MDNVSTNKPVFQLQPDVTRLVETHTPPQLVYNKMMTHNYALLIVSPKNEVSATESINFLT